MDPLILRKLEDFGRRWRGLILLRGVCGGFIALLAGMTLVAFADFLFILPESARWALSAVVYVATAAVVWSGCVRQLLQMPGTRDLARLVEKARPELREDLLSAVELGASSENQWDSEVFRAMLQSDVANRVRDLEMVRILPRSLIAAWLRAATAALAGCAVLFLLPGLHYNRLMVRALAPMANVERVSKTRIVLLEPRATDRWQPQGDNLPVIVQIAGPEPEKVILETFPKGAESDRLAMALVGGRRYAATIPLGVETLEFRVRAGDGVTRRFAINTRPRPHVVKFDKTFHFPAYARMPDRHAVEENGDLTELEGSDVELKLQLNQAIKEGEIEIESKGTTNRISLEAGPAREVSAHVPLKQAGVYRVRLVAAETGFENKFSPQYEIRPVPDLVPRVAIDQPRQDAIVPPEEVVLLQASATDDIGLAKVIQVILLNEEPYGQITLMEERKTNAVISRRWDLLEMRVAPGDRVTTKLIAIDVKGNQGESAPLHLVISSPGFDSKRLRVLESKRLLRDTLSSIHNASAELKKSFSPEMAKKVREGDELTRKQLLAGATTALDDLGRQFDKAQGQTHELLKMTRTGRDSSDVSLAARAISRARQEVVVDAKANVDALMHNAVDTPERPAVKAATDSISQLGDYAARLDSMFTDMLAADEADAVTENLFYVSEEEERMNREAEKDAVKDANAWDRLARRQGGAAKEAQFTEDMIKTLRDHVTKSAAERLGRTLENLKISRTSLEKALNNTPSKSILAPARDLQQGVELALKELRSASHELASRADHSRDEFVKAVGSAVAKVDSLRTRLEEQAAAERKVAESQKRNAEDPRVTLRARTARTMAAGQWKSSVEQLKNRAEIEEMRHDTDPNFVADVTKASQAIGQLQAVAQGDQQAGSVAGTVKEIGAALRVLEAGHQLVELYVDLKDLAQEERWEKHAPDARVSRPRDWNVMEKALAAAPAELKKSGWPDKTVGIVRDLARSNPAQDISREMSQRLDSQKPVNPIPEKADALAEAIRLALAGGEDAMAKAREELTGATPKLQEIMAGLGRAAEALEKEANATVKEEAPTREEAARLAQEQKELNAQIEELQAALRRDANVQDLSSPEGRERSRDADDAVAMLREPPVKAAESLQQAATTSDTTSKKASLTEAATQDEKLASFLKQLSDHYGKLAAGKADDTRLALRANEEDLGIKTGLDEQYQLAQKLGEMSKESPEDLLKKLEAELAKNPVMRQELGGISKDELADSKQTLQNAVDTEKGIAKSLAETKDAPERMNALKDKAARLFNQVKDFAGKDLPEAAQSLPTAAPADKKNLSRDADAAKSEADKALENADKSPDAIAVEAAALAQVLKQTESDLKSAADSAAGPPQRVKTNDPKPVVVVVVPSNKAKDAAAQANNLEDQLAQLADSLSAAAQSSFDQTSSQAARVQERLADRVDDAGRDIERAGRHEGRLGTPEGDALQQVGKQTQQVADGDIPKAQKALAPDCAKATGQQAVEQAGAAVAKQLDALDQTLAKAAPQAPRDASDAAAAQPMPKADGDPDSAAPPTPTQSKMMARTLDQLDASLHAKEKKPSEQEPSDENQDASKQAQNAAKDAMKAASQAQKSSMMAARANGNTPGEKPDSEDPGDGQGAKLVGDRRGAGAVPQVRGLREGEWGKLPPKIAQGLIEAQRERPSGDYQNQIETYFRVVADRARDRQP